MTQNYIKSTQEERILFHGFTGQALPDRVTWNELMPVVEEIESLGYTVEISETYCFVSRLGKNIININGIEYRKLSATYQAVTEFIKWYNQNSK